MNLTARVARRVVAVTAVTGAVALTPASALAAPGGLAGRPGAAGQAGAMSAVPAGFRANSLSWTSSSQGRVLGTAPCGRGSCSDVIGTGDGGRTWRLLGTVEAAITGQHPGITEIRFSTPDAGWAFGPRLFRTGNGGRSWSPATIPGHGNQVLDLAADSAGAYAVVSPCAWGAGRGPCRQPLSLWRTGPLARGPWTRIPLDLPARTSAEVAVSGQTVYVTARAGSTVTGKVYVSSDGRGFSARTSPCSAAQDLGLAQVVATSATDVSFLCIGNAGFSQAVKSVFRSADTGKTDTFAGRPGLAGIAAELAVSPSGNMAVASCSDGSFIYINDGHQTAWTMAIGLGDGGAGWNDLTYLTDSVAWVVYGPAADTAGIGKLYVTRDSGRHWTPVRT